MHLCYVSSLSVCHCYVEPFDFGTLGFSVLLISFGLNLNAKRNLIHPVHYSLFKYTTE